MEHEALSRGTKLDPTLEESVFHKVESHPLYPLREHFVYLRLRGFFSHSLFHQVKIRIIYCSSGVVKIVKVFFLRGKGHTCAITDTCTDLFNL